MYTFRIPSRGEPHFNAYMALRQDSDDYDSRIGVPCWAQRVGAYPMSSVEIEGAWEIALAEEDV